MQNLFFVSGNVSSAPAVKSFTTKKGGEVTYTQVPMAHNDRSREDAPPMYLDVEFFQAFEAGVALKMAVGEPISVCGQLSWRTAKDKNGNSVVKYTLKNASFAPGCLPPKKEEPSGRAAPSQAAEDDGLPF